MGNVIVIRDSITTCSFRLLFASSVWLQ